jgi:acylphosphatase
LGAATRGVRYLVAGRVQGVFFRAATAEAAARLELGGWVRNLPDGSVEVVAVGSEPSLADLARWLWQGPPAARVTSVRVEEWLGPTPTSFEIRR